MKGWGDDAVVARGLGSDAAELAVVIPIGTSGAKTLAMRAQRSVNPGESAVSSAGRIETGMALMARDMLGRWKSEVPKELKADRDLPGPPTCGPIDLKQVSEISESDVDNRGSVDDAMRTCRWRVLDDMDRKATVAVDIDSYATSPFTREKPEQVAQHFFNAIAEIPPRMEPDGDSLLTAAVDGSWQAVKLDGDQIVQFEIRSKDIKSEKTQRIGKTMLERITGL